MKNTVILLFSFMILSSSGCEKYMDTKPPVIKKASMQMVNYGPQRAVKIHVEAEEGTSEAGIWKCEYYLDRYDHSSANADWGMGSYRFQSSMDLPNIVYQLNKDVYLPINGSPINHPFTTGRYIWRIWVTDYAGNSSYQLGEIMLQ